MNLKKELSIRAWMYRLMLGPAMMLDGVITTFTLSYVNLGASLWTARKLTTARIAASREIK